MADGWCESENRASEEERSVRRVIVKRRYADSESDSILIPYCYDLAQN